MRINSLYLKNIRSFEEAEITFVKSNFITGWNLDTGDGNGVGKSTVIIGILLLLGGAKFSDINLKKFVKDGEKSAELNGVIEVGDDIIEIERILKVKGSSTLKIKINGKDPECVSAKIYQDKLFEYIGSAENFKKFRIIDASSGINILDFTSGQLRKTLMGICQDKFDGVRKKILEKKNLYEKYNKNAVIYKHAPSIKRSEILESAIKSLETSKLNELVKKIQSFQIDKNKLLTQKGKLSQVKDIKSRQVAKLQAMNQCPSCFQTVPKEHTAKICEGLQAEFQGAVKQITTLLSELKMYDDILQQEEKKKTAIYTRKQKLSGLKSKLQTRLAQKEYVYTKEDVEIAKQAIDMIDAFGNFYVVEWVKVIEPIVNSYISELNMSMKFIPDEKGDIEVTITRNEKEFTYDMLSQGEKIFISTVFKIALLMERQESGLIVADEAFNSLSGENLNRILEVISNLPVQLLCISHNPDIDKALASEIFIQKENDISTIKE